VADGYDRDDGHRGDAPGTAGAAPSAARTAPAGAAGAALHVEGVQF